MTADRSYCVAAILLALASVFALLGGGSTDPVQTANPPDPVQGQSPVRKDNRWQRFDNEVRDDFFAAMFGDRARLEVGMKKCEDALAKDPRHAEALVWHGGGLLLRAQIAYTQGKDDDGDRLWRAGMDEMKTAVSYAPDHIGVRLGRSALLLGIAQSGWNPNDPEGRKWLESAVEDHEIVLRKEGPWFRKLSEHSQGELLFGLAIGWSRLGNEPKARSYLQRIVRDLRGSAYEEEAREWLRKRPLPYVNHTCIGCH